MTRDKLGNLKCNCIKINRDKIGTQICYIHQCTNKGMLMYIACLCPNLFSVDFYAIPILHFKFLDLGHLLAKV